MQLRNLTLALRYSAADDEVAPDEDSPPTSVYEAVEAAKSQCGDLLEFGSDVVDGVSGLRDDAGPPDKIFRYLEQLAKMTRLRKAGELGTDPVRWLAAQGVDASGEGETVRNSPAQMARRRWNDGKTRREFTQHLKPNESTSPDLCVRIYFRLRRRPAEDDCGMGRSPPITTGSAALPRSRWGPNTQAPVSDLCHSAERRLDTHPVGIKRLGNRHRHPSPAGRAADRRGTRLRPLRAHRRRALLQPPRRPPRAALDDRC